MNRPLLLTHFQDRLQTNVSLSKFTTSRVGGIAAYLVEESELAIFKSDVEWCWQNEIPLMVLGGGANIIVSSSGIDKLVFHNRCSKIEVKDFNGELVVHAESGAMFTAVSRFASQRSLAGLEWACALPGSLGGAVYGNAGAFGSDMSKSLKTAYILHREIGGKAISADEMGYSYRSSILKRDPGSAIILAADLKVQQGKIQEINAIVDGNIAKRKATQPGGASTGSTFKNPVGDHAGRLIEAAGLKGTTIGGVQVSPMHANFLINDGTGTPEDYYRLIQLIQKTVADKFGVSLELEIELLGEWQESK